MNYSLVRGPDLLARVLDAQLDMPWHYATLEPAPAWNEVRETFMHAQQLFQQQRFGELDAIWDELLASGLRLVPDDGSRPIDDFVLHVDGASCWFRF